VDKLLLLNNYFGRVAEAIEMPFWVVGRITLSILVNVNPSESIKSTNDAASCM